MRAGVGRTLSFSLETGFLRSRFLRSTSLQTSLSPCVRTLSGYGLFVSSWCAERFRSSYEPDAPVVGAWAIRGGGSLFWPWQDSGEWAFCVSAMRMPSSDLAAGLSGARFVRDLSHLI